MAARVPWEQRRVIRCEGSGQPGLAIVPAFVVGGREVIKARPAWEGRAGCPVCLSERQKRADGTMAVHRISHNTLTQIDRRKAAEGAGNG